MHLLRTLFFCGVSAAVGVFCVLHYQADREARRLPPLGTLVTQVRDVARLETLEVTLHKKIVFEPAAGDTTDDAWTEVWRWAQHVLRPARGKVIVFAVARLGLDLSQLGPDNIRVEQDTVLCLIPPLQADVELLPQETEVIGSNLDTAETVELLETARQAFLAQIERDQGLQNRARASAERALTGLIVSLGFKSLRFVTTLPPRVSG